MEPCQRCKGTGELPTTELFRGRRIDTRCTCTICHGAGNVEVEPVKASPVTPHPSWNTVRLVPPILLHERRNTPFSTLIRTSREALGISQVELARRVGCDHSYIGRIEGGIRLPSLRMMGRMAPELRLSIFALVTAALESLEDEVV